MHARCERDPLSVPSTDTAKAPAGVQLLLDNLRQSPLDITEFRLQDRAATACLYARNLSLARAPIASAAHANSCLAQNNTLSSFGGLEADYAHLLFQWVPKSLASMPSLREVYIVACDRCGTQPCSGVVERLPVTIGKFTLPVLDCAGTPLDLKGIVALLPVLRLSAASLVTLTLRGTGLTTTGLKLILGALRDGLWEEVGRRNELLTRRVAHLKRLHGVDTSTSLQASPEVNSHLMSGRGANGRLSPRSAQGSSFNAATPLPLLMRWGEDPFGSRRGVFAGDIGSTEPNAPAQEARASKRSGSVMLDAAPSVNPDAEIGDVSLQATIQHTAGELMPSSSSAGHGTFATAGLKPLLETLDVSGNVGIDDTAMPMLLHAIAELFCPSLVHVAVTKTSLSRQSAETLRSALQSSFDHHRATIETAFLPPRRTGSPPRRIAAMSPREVSSRAGLSPGNGASVSSNAFMAKRYGLPAPSRDAHSRGGPRLSRSEFNRCVTNFRALMSPGTGVCDLEAVGKSQPSVAAAVTRLVADAAQGSMGCVSVAPPPRINARRPGNSPPQELTTSAAATTGADGPGKSKGRGQLAAAGGTFTFIQYLQAMCPTVSLRRLLHDVETHSEYVLVAPMVQRTTEALLLDQQLELLNIFETLVASIRHSKITAEVERLSAEKMRDALDASAGPRTPLTLTPRAPGARSTGLGSPRYGGGHGSSPPASPSASPRQLRTVKDLDDAVTLQQRAAANVDATFDADRLSAADFCNALSEAGAEAARFVLQRSGYDFVDRTRFMTIAGPYIIDQRRRKRFR
jgi:hypothetical protein